MRLNILKYFIVRVIKLLPVLFVIITLSFFMMRLAPGGPFDTEKALSVEVKQSIESLYGLDKPVAIQYLIYLKNVASGDLGYSFTYLNEPVSKLIIDSFKISFTLGIIALFLALAVGMSAGIASALNRGRLIDYFFFSFTLLGVSVPSIVLGPFLVLIFGIWLGFLPVAGWGTLSHVVLPAVTLGGIYMSYIARLTRAGFVENLDKEYVKTASSLGMSRKKVIMKFVLKDSLLPLISYIGPAFAGIVTGSLIVETIFRINGLGTYFVQSALNRDYPLAMGVVIFYSAILLIVNLICDILSALMDPRIKLEKN